MGSAIRTLNGDQIYTMAQVLLPTAHQAMGALMFASTLLVVLKTWRRYTPIPPRGVTA